MTWIIRVENPDMESPNRILHGELAAKVGDIFRNAGQEYKRVKVAWEDDVPEADPFYGQRPAMLRYAHEILSKEEVPEQATKVKIVSLLRKEWKDKRGFTGIGSDNPYIALHEYADVAGQALKGWKRF